MGENFVWMKSGNELQYEGANRGGWGERTTNHLQVATLLVEYLYASRHMQKGERLNWCIGFSADDKVGFKFSSCAQQGLHNDTEGNRKLTPEQEARIMEWLAPKFPDISAINKDSGTSAK